MMANLSKILADPDSVVDLAGAFGLLAGVIAGCWIGGAFGWWGL